VRLRELIARDRFAAHEELFGHRHEYASAPFHRELVEDFWSEDWACVDLGFRECGKTTLVEEDLVMTACEGLYRNIIIVGAKEMLAAELLQSVKTEIEQNEVVQGVYRVGPGHTWTQTKVVLSNGVCIQAIGRDQSLRGTKYEDRRPDLVIVNDFEDDEDLLTPEGRRRTLRWFLRILLPACDRRRRRIRIYDTVRDAESVPMLLIRQEGWRHRFIPISYLDEAGEERSSWPGHPTLTTAWIEKERALYRKMGALDIWEREYMCNAASEESRVFTSEMIRVEPQERVWQRVYAMIDPARSIGRGAATTGWAVWSWVRHRLIVWEAGAKRLLPDEIVELAYRIGAEYDPVEIGIEEDGLNEWLNQPIRQEAVRRRRSIPYIPVKAPRGKLDFIRGLQPFFKAREVVFAQESADLREQILSFPTGRIDAPNALAYALLLRPGRLMYENFIPEVHIVDEAADLDGTLYLFANAADGFVACGLFAIRGREAAILADWIVEGDPQVELEGIVREASMIAGRRFEVVCPPKHFEMYGNVGLAQAARALGLEVRQGGEPLQGRAWLRKELEKRTRDGATFLVSSRAHAVINAMAGGYEAESLRSETAKPGRYKILMEGLESFCALLDFGLQDDRGERNMRVGTDGRHYLSAMPGERVRG
jgi:hypothetical protein